MTDQNLKKLLITKFKKLKNTNSGSQDTSHIFSPKLCTASCQGRANQIVSPLSWSDRPQEGANYGTRTFLCLLVPISWVPTTPTACLYGIYKECINSGSQVVLATAFCAVSPRHFGVLSMDPCSCYHTGTLNFERSLRIFGKIVHLCILPLLLFV